jgi:hypothetical protein
MGPSYVAMRVAAGGRGLHVKYYNRARATATPAAIRAYFMSASRVAV